MKKFFAILMIFATLFAFVACTPEQPPVGDVVVTDQAGRTVVIQKEPQRIVSGYYITTSLLIALELKDKIVGVENQAYKREIYSISAPNLLDLPGLGTVKEFDIEGCLALDPDLVILPLKLKTTAQRLEELGVDVIVVNPESQTLVAEMISLVGKATNTQNKASELLDFISAQTNRLSLLLSNVTKPKVYLAGNSNMLSTAGNAMYQADMIRLAGGTNVANQIDDTYWATISYEQLLVWDPEYIIIAADANYTVQDVLTNPNISNCNAIKNGKVFKLPSKAEAWDSPVPGGILGAVWLSSILHPDLCKESITNDIIDEFYEKFYGFKYSKK